MELYVPKIEPKLPQTTLELLELAKTHNFKEICDIYDANPEECICNFLARAYSDFYKDPNALRVLKEYYDNKIITGDKILLLTDTHIGDRYIVPKLLDITYNHALKRNVKTAIHLGDIIEGDCGGIENSDVETQIKILKQYYPETEITTHYITGNHDETFHGKNVKCYELYKQALKSIKGLEFFSRLRTFANINGHRTMLYHCDAYSKHLPAFDYDIKLCGHSHCYNFDENNRELTVPHLKSSNPSTAGFVMLYYDRDEYNIEQYGFDNNLNPIVKDVKRLKYKK